MNFRFGRGPARGRYVPGVMNKLEMKYRDKLELDKSAGLVIWYAFEAIKFKLADKTYYTPDFLVMNAQGEMECHEVKGFWEDDARVKIKCAAEKFPFKFLAIKQVRGLWEYEEI